jgi:hypothetical protein
MSPASVINGFVLEDCCRWFEFEVVSVDASDARSRMSSRIVHRGERRSFYGFNRSRHAVLEAAILATRLHLIERSEVEFAMNFLKPAVEKTGGLEEKEAFRMLECWIHDGLSKLSEHRKADASQHPNQPTHQKGQAG